LWEWRANDGTYVRLEKEQCGQIETCWRKRQEAARVCGKKFPEGQYENLKGVIDLGDMTGSTAGSEWVTAIRRWDHQVDDVSIVRVEPEWLDYVVASAFFEAGGRESGGCRGLRSALCRCASKLEAGSVGKGVENRRRDGTNGKGQEDKCKVRTL
jgi:hypothetical protein